MIRRPPRSTLFLHDALPISDEDFRSVLFLDNWGSRKVQAPPRKSLRENIKRRRPTSELAHGSLTRGWNRSEEHTSELQSRLHLVCRLLLENKTRREIYQRLH